MTSKSRKPNLLTTGVEVAVQEVAVRKVAVQEVVVQEVAVQKVAVQKVVVQEVAVQEVAVQEVAVQEVAVQEVAVQEVGVQEVAPAPVSAVGPIMSSTANLPEVRAEVAAAQAVVHNVMKAPIPSIRVADNVVPENLRELLNRELDIITTRYKDYNPETNNKVQAPIDPSLFPYIDGVSSVWDPSTLPPNLEGYKYQWLPAQFSVSKDGSTSVKSYINNLDPFHHELYTAIELSFSLFLPMFEGILNRSLRSRQLQVIVKAVNYVVQPGFGDHNLEWNMEGMLHERIVASGLYYSTSLNLFDKRFTFHPGNKSTFLRTDGRLIVFGKVLHKFLIGNASDTKVGTRKILGFFLVDPDCEIISTKHVPEQQWDRVRPRTMTTLNEVVMKVIGRWMPTEILLDIMEWTKTGFTSEEERQHRLPLVEERLQKMKATRNVWIY